MGSTGDYKFQGWMGLDKNCVKGQMKWQQYEPKTWQETDVDIKVTHCGICASDLHTLRSGWGPTMYPCCVGHEVVGTAVKVGKNVEGGIKVGDRVGVGAQSSSCLKPECEECASGQENHCQIKMTGTYNGTYLDGSKSYGGYSDYCRVPSHFVIKIPDAITSEEAAPMLCGGITTYAPLKHNGCGPGKRVGIVGIGGLGHFGLLYAKALGADKITAISRKSEKKADAMKMGADTFIATEEEPDWATKYGNSLDLIVCTVSSPTMPLEQYLQLLRVKGQFIQVGAPEDPIPGFRAFSLIGKGIKIGGSAIGTPAEIKEMLELSVKQKVNPWVQKRPLKDANQAVVDMEANKARYRYVLVNEAHA
ncbi:MAG: Peptidyl-prolyl cis-trans isomerase cyp8 [Chaenotheca gracillima]|nr:MAG: Peptidyl-prolyl cis-trans isomerase cyp8 [Chaenotheca gracillima]